METDLQLQIFLYWSWNRWKRLGGSDLEEYLGVVGAGVDRDGGWMMMGKYVPHKIFQSRKQKVNIFTT